MGIKRVIIIFIILIGGIGACSPPKKPKVSLKEWGIGEIDKEEMTVNFKVGIENINPFDITVNGVEYNLYIDDNDKEFTKGAIDQKITIKGLDTTIVEIPVKINYSSLFNSLESIILKRIIPFRIEGSVVLKVYFLEKRINLHFIFTKLKLFFG